MRRMRILGNYSMRIRIATSYQMPCSFLWASDMMWKKIKDYAEIFGHIMRKHALIMRKFKYI